MDKKIIIFDLDGTLLNTLEDLKDSTNFALKTFNYPTRNIEDIRQFVGNGVAKLIERAIPQGKDNPDFEKCLETFKKHYSKNMYNKTAPYPQILETLETLKQKGYKTAVVSNKFDMAVKELCKKYFPNLIDFAAGENEACGIRKKPAPDTIIKTLEEFNLQNNEAIYVGDSDVDIMTAKNSDMPCISVTWGFRDKEFLSNHNAEIIINSPIEIIEILENKIK
uniref:Phosphoglycolate phosphatase n=1 Tax=uncultured Candidatus Melainabacteria bacterium TaxID=2682970 RepID=A0A650EJ83_9BACT|nr:phosphoglycolate phosphatase [uncultured Candidatus Melainabacteria bacterium]